MSLSIFNFENIARYRRLPAVEKRWHAVVVLTMAATFFLARSALLGLAAWHRNNEHIAARRALSERTEVIFLGNSHFYCGIRPDRFPFPAMTVAGSGFNYQHLEGVLRRHLGRLSGLRLVVIAFDANPLLNETAPLASELADWGLPVTMRNRAPRPWHKKSPAVLVRDLDAWFRNLVAPPERLTPTMLLTSWGLLPDRVIPGFAPTSVQFRPQPGVSERVVRHSRLFKESQFEPNCASLLRIIRLLDSQGVRVVLLRTPFHPSYVAQRPRRWEELCEEALARVRAERSLAHVVPVWDLMEHPDFVDADFRDEDHLNARGSVRLCALLNDRLAPLMAQIESTRRPRQVALDPNSRSE
jgi:hypothetical protein